MHCGGRSRIDRCPQTNGLPAFFAKAFSASPSPRYYSDFEVQRQGPVTLEELVIAYGHRLDADSLIWKKGMKDWAPLRDVPEVIPYATLSFCSHSKVSHKNRLQPCFFF